jgi:hypothetical protein
MIAITRRFFRILAMRAGQPVAPAGAMRGRLRVLVVAGVALGVLGPTVVSAVTVDQVLALKRAGVTDTVVLALIDRDRTVFAIEPEQIIALQRDGLSEAVILAMLRSGREEGDQAARADAASNAAAISAALAPAPELVIVGHGPDRPNTPVHDFYSSPPAPFYLPVPYGIPSYSRSFSPSRHRQDTPSSGARRFDAPRSLCYAQVNTPRTTAPLSFVTECPAPMQPRRPR